MTHLIDKDALVAEIKSYKSAAEWMLNGKTDLEHWRSQKGTCEKLLSFINTLEVKEVDLEKEIDKWYNNEASKEFEDVLYEDIEKCAEHFFELGLKAQHDKVKEVDLELITGWFDHVAQMADDRKTLNGEVMEDWAALDEIKCLAKNSSEFITKHYKAQKGEKV